MTPSPVKSIRTASTKVLLLVLTCTSSGHATTTSEPLPPVSLISCEQSIDKTREWLVSKQAFVPFISNTRPRRIEPRVAIEYGDYSQQYLTYPSGRPEKIVFYLSGDADRIWQGVLGSPQTLTTFASLMMASCPRVGMVEYRHWFEGYLPVGYFPDNTAKAFTWVDASDSRVRDWGFFYSP